MAVLFSFPRTLFSLPRSLNPSPSPSLPSSLSPLFRSNGRYRPITTRTTAEMGSSPSVARASSTPDFDGSIGEALGDVSIFAASTGEPVFFRDLLDQNEGIAVVALLRHFGCICCWELASVLKNSKSTFDSAGVKLIAVGVGTPDKARILAERLPFPLDCLYADPDRKAYDLFGLYYGLGRTFFNRATVKAFSRFGSIKKAANNYTIAATPDDKSSVLQQGGMFVFKGKQLLYARKDEGTGDHAPLDEILDICCKAPVA